MAPGQPDLPGGKAAELGLDKLPTKEGFAPPPSGSDMLLTAEKATQRQSRGRECGVLLTKAECCLGMAAPRPASQQKMQTINTVPFLEGVQARLDGFWSKLG